MGSARHGVPAPRGRGDNQVTAAPRGRRGALWCPRGVVPPRGPHSLRPAAATARREAAQRQQRRPPQRTQAGRAAGRRGAPQLTTESVDGRGAREDERGGEGEEGGLDLVGVRVRVRARARARARARVRVRARAGVGNRARGAGLEGGPYDGQELLRAQVRVWIGLGGQS